MILVNGLTKVKNVLILGLRSFFANSNNYVHLFPPNLAPDALSRIKIYDGHPQDLRSFPMIVIAGSNGQMVPGGISNDFATETYDENGDLEGYMYAGFYNFSVDVEIGTRTTLEREILMDITASAIRWSLRRVMEKQGVLVKDVSYGGEAKIQYDSDYIYTSVINVQTFSEWHEYYKLLPLDGVTFEQATRKQDGTVEKKKVIVPNNKYNNLAYKNRPSAPNYNNNVNNNIYNFYQNQNSKFTK